MAKEYNQWHVKPYNKYIVIAIQYLSSLPPNADIQWLAKTCCCLCPDLPLHVLVKNKKAQTEAQSHGVGSIHKYYYYMISLYYFILV